MNKRFLAVVLATVILLTGCGKGSPLAQNSGGKEGNLTGSEAESENKTSMGRYVESESDTLADILQMGIGFEKKKDGTLYAYDTTGDVYESKNDGESFEPYQLESLDKFCKEYDTYFTDMKMASDKSIWASVSVTKGEDENDDFSPKLYHFLTDGTSTQIELPLTEEDMYPVGVFIGEDDRVFVTTYSNNIYEVKEDGTVDILLTCDCSPDLIQVHQNIMIIDSANFKDGILIYDMEKKQFIEDIVLSDFVKEYYKERETNGKTQHNTYFFFGEDGALYIAGRKGLHRHVIGGGSVEEVINGELSALSNPNNWFIGMVELSNNEFLMETWSHALIHFKYDATIPTIPEKMIKVYSLSEQSNLLTAVSTYQALHPDVFVKYEIGLTDDSMTKEDAIKNLNTKIMAGEGPDVFVLDNLPLDSYMQKGVLMDLKEVVTSMQMEQPLYENMVKGMERDEKLYMLPGQVCFPVIGGSSTYVSKMNHFDSYAEQLKNALNNAKPNQEIFQLRYSPKAVMKMFTPSCAPYWKDTNGKINKEEIKDFLEQAKDIYDVTMQGATDKSRNRYEQLQQMMQQEFGTGYEDHEYFHMINTITYVSGGVAFLCGNNDTPYNFAELYSLPQNKNGEDFMFHPIVAKDKEVFIPSLLMAINDASSHKDEAVDFIKEFFSEEVQQAMGGYSVNKKALEKSLLPDPKYYKEGEPTFYCTSSDEDGNMVDMEIYWPVGDDLKPIYDIFEKAKVPYLQDAFLEEAIYEAGAKYFEGEINLEEALNEIESKVSLYMAE